MKVKRFIAWLTAIGVMLNLTFSAFANVDKVPIPDRLKGNDGYTVGKTISADEYASIFKILTYLDIFDENIKDTEAESYVERGFAAQTFARILSPELELTQMSGIPDVNENTKYAKGVYAALELGIIEGKEKFYPTRSITLNDAIVMAMKVLDYDFLPNENALLARAMDIGLYKKLGKISESMTMGQFMYLIRNLLESTFAEMETISSGKDDVELTMHESSSIFLERKNIVLRTGIVTAQGNTSLFGDSSLEKNEIEINRLNYKMIVPDDEDLLGKSVYAYVDTENQDTVVAVWDIEKKNNESVIFGDEIISFNTTSVYYQRENGKKVRESISTAAKVIYNNQYYGTMSRAMSNGLLNDVTRLVLKDYDTDNTADVVQIEKSRYVVVNSVSAISKTISLMYGEGKIDAEANKDSFKLYMDEAEAELSALAKWDVLQVLQANRQDGKINYTVKAARKSITGVLRSIENRNSAYVFEIDDKEYYAATEYKKYVEQNPAVQTPKIGEKAVFMLSDDEKIVAVQNESECEFAYVITAGLDGSLKKQLGIKVYATDGKTKTLMLSENAKLFSSEYPDGEKLSPEEMHQKIMAGETPLVDVVGYKLNTDGLIKELYLEQNRIAYEPGTTDYPINKNYTAGGSGTYMDEAWLYTRVMAGKYSIDSQMPIIVVPEAEKRKDETLYAINNLSAYSSDYYFVNETISLYNVDKFYNAGFAVVTGGLVKSIDEYKSVFMISRVTHGTYNDEDVLKLYYYNGEKEVSINVLKSAEVIENTAESSWYGAQDVTLNDLKKGDVVQIESDSSGMGSIVRVLFKIDNKGSYRVQYRDSSAVQAASKDVSSVQKLMMIYAKVIDVEGTSAIINVSDSGADTAHSYPVFFTGIYGNSTFSLYDTATKTVYPAKMEEIQPGDDIVIRKRWNEACDGFIIR